LGLSRGNRNGAGFCSSANVSWISACFDAILLSDQIRTANCK
jgi:hypothetical protein